MAVERGGCFLWLDGGGGWKMGWGRGSGSSKLDSLYNFYVSIIRLSNLTPSPYSPPTSPQLADLSKVMAFLCEFIRLFCTYGLILIL